MNEKISVIIPVYNVSSYLERCMESVLNQTYTNLEIILVDDGSTDGSDVLCDKYMQQDCRVKVIHKKNGGLSDARNAGLKVVTGEYIAFLDSDDWIDLDYYEVLFKKLRDTSSDISIVGFVWVKGDKFIKPQFYLEDKIFTSREAISELAKDNMLTSHAWNKLFKRSLFDGIEFPVGRTYEDVFIMHKVFSRATQISVISDYKNYYFMHDKSIIHTLSAKNRLDEFFAFKSRYEDLKDEYPEIRNEMLERVYERIVNIYYNNHFSNADKKIYKKEMKEIREFTKENIKLLGTKRKIMVAIPKIFGVAFKLKKKMPKKLKKIIKALKVNRNVFDKLDLSNGKGRIILCGSPEYGNIGDLAIAYFTKQFVERNTNKNFIEITESEFHRNSKLIRKNILPKDIILLQGGGNMGSQYIDQEKIRSKVIKMFPNNKIVIMPQTIYFSDDDYGRNMKEIIKERYSLHQSLNIFAREEFSFETMKNLFKNDVYLTPDIVMSSMLEFEDLNRKGAMLCLRSDVEGILDVNDLMKIKTVVRNKFDNYYLTDTVYNTDIKLEDRESVLFDFWKKIKKSELVITDRLHGMIFAAITGTPCIVIGNYNHKVKMCYKWYESLEYIEFCDSINEVEEKINQMDFSKRYRYSGTQFMKKFEALKKVME